MDIDTPALDRLEAALRIAATRFAARAVQPTQHGTSDDTLSQCLGIRPDGRVRACDPSSAPLAVRRAILDGLDREDARLIRMARRLSPAYDLNRHLAVRRLLNRWAKPAAGTPAPRVVDGWRARRMRAASGRTDASSLDQSPTRSREATLRPGGNTKHAIQGNPTDRDGEPHGPGRRSRLGA